MSSTDMYTDGNALAGPLGEIFAVDITVARGRCAGCGRVDEGAALRPSDPDPARVARSPGGGGGGRRSDATRQRPAPGRPLPGLRGGVAAPGARAEPGLARPARHGRARDP